MCTNKTTKEYKKTSALYQASSTNTLPVPFNHSEHCTADIKKKRKKVLYKNNTKYKAVI